MSDLEFDLHSYRDGTIGFAELVWRTEDDWRRLAHHLVGKWQIPSTVTADDIQQELLLGCWQHVGRWDPSRGVSLKRYVVWNACALAVAFIHRQRSALKRRDKSPSRHPLLLTPTRRENGTESEVEMIDRLMMEPWEDRNIMRYEASRDALSRCDDELAERCLLAFADQADLGRAATVVFGRNNVAGRSAVRQVVEGVVHAG